MKMSGKDLANLKPSFEAKSASNEKLIKDAMGCKRKKKAVGGLLNMTQKHNDGGRVKKAMGGVGKTRLGMY